MSLWVFRIYMFSECSESSVTMSVSPVMLQLPVSR